MHNHSISCEKQTVHHTAKCTCGFSDQWGSVKYGRTDSTEKVCSQHTVGDRSHNILNGRCVWCGWVSQELKSHSEGCSWLRDRAPCDCDKKPKAEAVNHPAHYGGAENPYEAIKVIENWGLDFSLGNCVKYISRAGKKDPAKTLEDLKKSAWYLNRAIANLEKIK